MLQASNFVQSMELNKGVKISCLEEIAVTHGFIDAEIALKNCKQFKNNDYYKYVRQVLKYKIPVLT